MKKRLCLLGMILTLSFSAAACSSSSEGEISVTAAESDSDTSSSSDGSDTSSAQSAADPADSTAQTEDSAGTSDSSGTADTAADAEEAESTTSFYTEDGALAIALADSGLSEDSLTGTRVWLKQKKNTQIYKVNLYAEAEEYSYEIDASTGEILEKEYDYEEEYSSTVSVPSGVISRSEAIALVLARVDGSTEWDIRIKLDKDDGQYIWEGDLFYNGVEYEFEMNGATGTFLEWEA